MHSIYFGYSTTLSGEEMIRYFDIDPNHEEGVSKFEQEFGCEYVEPGSFEVYGRDDYKDVGFDASLLERLLPFTPDKEHVGKIDFGEAKSVFYIKTDHVDRMENPDIRLIGPMFIEKFDFE